MARRAAGLAALLVVGCLSTVTIDSSPDATRSDAAQLPVDRGGTRDDQGRATDDGGVPIGDLGPAPVLIVGCGRCAEGQVCCYTTGRCYDPASPASCGTPPRTADPRACASDAQCASGEICERPDVAGACVGVGTCRARRPPSDCGGFGDGVCGCDGQTYLDPCAATRAGARVAAMAPCGRRAYPDPGGHYACVNPGPCSTGWTCDVAMGQCIPDRPLIACGTDAQCGAGQFCCPYTGLCVATADRDLCRQLLEGSVLGCRTNDDCQPLEDYGSGNRFYCANLTEGCGGVGSCARRPTSCTGELTPVCGCDGRPYTNPCEAGRQRTRVAHAGACP